MSKPNQSHQNMSEQPDVTVPPITGPLGSQPQAILPLDIASQDVHQDDFIPDFSSRSTDLSVEQDLVDPDIVSALEQELVAPDSVSSLEQELVAPDDLSVEQELVDPENTLEQELVAPDSTSQVEKDLVEHETTHALEQELVALDSVSPIEKDLVEHETTHPLEQELVAPDSVSPIEKNLVEEERVVDVTERTARPRKERSELRQDTALQQDKKPEEEPDNGVSLIALLDSELDATDATSPKQRSLKNNTETDKDTGQLAELDRWSTDRLSRINDTDTDLKTPTRREQRRLAREEKQRLKRRRKAEIKAERRAQRDRRKRYRRVGNRKILEDGTIVFPGMRVVTKKRFLSPKLAFDFEMDADETILLSGVVRPLNPKTTFFGRLWWWINPWRARFQHHWFQTALIRLFATIIVVGLGTTLTAGVVFAAMVATAEIPTIVATQPALLYTSEGEQYASLYSKSNREDIPIEELPVWLPDALIAAEDNSFRTHIGVDPVTILRALVANVRKGKIDQGGSTITQQYVKVARREDAPTVWRKITEAAVAIKLEQTYNKDKILELYLNNVYFGRGANGIEQAAQAYFNKSARNLTMQESAMLIGILPAPSEYDPILNPKKTQVRYGYVLRRMVEEHFITQADMDSSIYNRPLTFPPPISTTDPYPWMTDMVRRELAELGFDDGGDMVITTTLRPDLQKKMQVEYDEAFQKLDSTATMVTVDNETGEVVAAIGGKDYKKDQLNLLNSERQPGSTFKVFALIAYLEKGYAPGATFTSPPKITFSGADNGKDWVVNNFAGEGVDDGKQISVATATALSSNTTYAQIAKKVGREAVADVANRALNRPRAHMIPAYLSLVLGTEEVNMVELAGGYATIAADGQLRSPYVIKDIHRYGELIYSAHLPDKQVFNPQVTRMATYMLQQVAKRGTATRANFGRPIAVKTGTTQGHGDAWLAGFTKQFTTVVWMGNRDNRNQLANKETGGGLPAMVWRDYMRRIHGGLPVEKFTAPDWDAFNGNKLLPEQKQSTDE